MLGCRSNLTGEMIAIIIVWSREILQLSVSPLLAYQSKRSAMNGMEILPGLRYGDLSIHYPERDTKILSDWIRE